MKIQIPRMRSVGINQYDKLGLCESEKFLALWNPIVKEYQKDAKFPWNDNPIDGIFRVRVDESTQIFNSKSELLSGDTELYDKDVTCIIEVLKVFNYKKMSGITCRVHQMKIHDQEYLFTE